MFRKQIMRKKIGITLLVIISLAGIGWRSYKPIFNAITGSGTANFLPIFTGTDTIGNSRISDDGTDIRIDSGTSGRLMMGDTSEAGNITMITVRDSTGEIFFNGNVRAQNDLRIIGGLELGSMGGGYLTLDRAITEIGTTGNRTMHVMAGTVNLAAGASSITVTNSTVNANSIITPIARTNDACSVKNYVPANGSFVINMTQACTGETSVGFIVTN